jgi:hypothetical protein
MSWPAAAGLAAVAVAFVVLWRAERRAELARFDAELRLFEEEAGIEGLACLAGRHRNQRHRCAVCGKPKRLQ